MRKYKMNFSDKVLYLKQKLKSYENFPKVGINFQDIFSLLHDPQSLKYIIEIISDQIKQLPNFDAIIALDARGFIFGSILAYNFNIPFIPIRKKGKLPGFLHNINYELEYGQETFEIQENALVQGQKVLIIDDLLATGGSLKAACKLVQKLNANVLLAIVIIELEDLHGRQRIPSKVFSVLQL